MTRLVNQRDIFTVILKATISKIQFDLRYGKFRNKTAKRGWTEVEHPAVVLALSPALMYIFFEDVYFLLLGHAIFYFRAEHLTYFVVFFTV